ncbi:hypothetical protein H0H87_009637, partial [Tephrocybe sp. NHM501043]
MTVRPLTSLLRLYALFRHTLQLVSHILPSRKLRSRIFSALDLSKSCLKALLRFYSSLGKRKGSGPTDGPKNEDSYHTSIAYALGEPMVASTIQIATHNEDNSAGPVPGDIPLQTIPESAVPSPALVADVHNMAHQIIMQHPSETSGSRVSVVVPAAPALQEQTTQAGPSGRPSSVEGISDYIYPLMPVKIPRYKRDRRVPFKRAVYEIEAFQKDFSPGSIPPGWKQLTHPEGQPYFYHAGKGIITENWIWDVKKLQQINGFIEQFEDYIKLKNLTEPPGTHLVLECNEEDGVLWCGYYFASASTRTVWWLERFNISSFLMEIMGEPDALHV